VRTDYQRKVLTVRIKVCFFRREKRCREENMKHRSREKIEKVMMISAVAVMGVAVYASSMTGEWKPENPVFHAVHEETETEPEEAGAEYGEDSSKEPGQKAAERETDSISGVISDDIGEALPCGEESETIPGGGITFETDSVENRAAAAFTEIRVPGKCAAFGERAAARREMMTEDMDFVRKAEKEVRSGAEHMITLWEKQEEKTLVGLSYMGGMEKLYCVGATDLRPEKCMVDACYSDGSRRRLSPLMMQMEGFSAEKAGSFQGKISFEGKSVRIPYEVADFQVVLHPNGGACAGGKGAVCHLYNYTMEQAAVPERTGYVFDGWYLEEELLAAVQFPFQASEQVTHLYAGWKRQETSYVSENGILRLPENCTAIGKGEFSHVEGKVEELYVGAGILEIEPGAFLGLRDLSYIDVDWKNPVYTTMNCSLYTKDGKCLIASPNALTGLCRVHAGTEALEAYAFYESGISTLILPENLKEIGSFAFGRSLKILRFQGITPPKSLKREAFAGISEELIIEVPEEALETYQEFLGNFSPSLAEKVKGFRKE